MKELTNSEIKIFLENEPLYCPRSFLLPKNRQIADIWINEIDEYCEICNQIRPFHDMRSRGSGAGMPIPKLTDGTSTFVFTCVSCRKFIYRFNVEHILDEKNITLQKFGELPRKKLERTKALQNFFEEDEDYYEKAIVSLSNGYGIGAFAYFRRIIERNISRLLDMIENEIQNGDVVEESIKDALANLRKESPMSNKIKIANYALPPYLKLNGLNPLGKLYALLSEGVHQMSDEECLDKARTTKACLTFLITELVSRKKRREEFSKMIGNL